MAPIDLNHLRTFVTVCETGSFSNAAKKLAVPRSTVSRAIAALEEASFGVLFQRTTRRMSITPEGQRLLARVAPSLTSLDVALRDIPAPDETPSGTLRVTTISDVGVAILAEAVTRFVARYPAVSVEATMSTNVLDMVERGLDVAIRVVRTKLPPSTFVAQKIGEMEFHLYAAPSYLSRRGAPKVVDDLRDHDWVGYQNVRWDRFGKTNLEANVRARVLTDDSAFVRQVLRAGGGVGPLPSFVADEDVAAGLLVRVIPSIHVFTGRVYLVHHPRKRLTPKVRAFREIVLDVLRRRPLSPREG